MTKQKKEIGGRIRRIRNRLGLNQTEFGEHLGVVASSVSAYEKGETSPSFEMVAKIAKLAQISIDDLITGEPESASQDVGTNDVIRQGDETEGSTPTDPGTSDKSPAISSALESLFASVDFIKKKLISSDEPGSHSFRDLKSSWTGEVQVTEQERRLLSAFHKLDEKRQVRLIEEAEDMVLALASREKI